MIARTSAVSLVLLALAALVVTAGCSSRPTTSPTDRLASGNPSDPGPVPPGDSTPGPPPPPPPPPGIQPLTYLGADSARVGGTVTQRWALGNESSAPFTMSWTLESHAPWPGLPKSGTVTLQGDEVTELTTTAAVPDTAATGTRWLRLTVTRPDGLPNASADGHYLLTP